MGANAATKCFRVMENVEKILAIELMNAAQALEFRRPLKSSEVIEKLYAEYPASEAGFDEWVLRAEKFWRECGSMAENGVR